MSGAGRSTVAHALEDLGWYVVDNMPPALLGNLIELVTGSVKKVAVVIDIRGRAFFGDLTSLGKFFNETLVPAFKAFYNSIQDSI